MTHKLKIREEFFNALINDEKTYEIRKNDRDYQKGDKIYFTKMICQDGSIEEIKPQVLGEFIITHVFSNTEYGLKEGYVILSIKKI